VQVRLYATLRAIVGEKTVEVAMPDGATVLDLARAMVERWPGLRDHLLTDDGALSRRVNVFLDGRSVRWLPEGSATPLSSANAVDLFPPAAGG